MKKTMVFFLAVMNILLLQAQAPKTSWNLDKSHSSVNFSIDHMVVSEVEGKFKDFSAEAKSDKADFSDVQGAFTVVLKSIDTDNEKRDEHLRGADFFDVEKNPNLTFVIKKFTKVSGKVYKLTGDLTLHGVTKTVTLNGKFGGIIKDPYGLTRAGLSITGELDRYAFGLKYNAAMEAGGFALGQKVRIKVNLEFTQAK
ncbi:MAG: YceI family protein [Chitinophagales bacterium]|jgi:polyisoprenoid-binding protein YceI